MRILVFLLSLLLAGCVPAAVLRSPEPVRGAEFSLGGSLIWVTLPSNYSFLWALPYLGYAWGDGSTEFNLSVQMGPRFGVKQALAPGLSLDAGLTLARTPVPSVSGPILDVGLLAGVGELYVSPRVHVWFTDEGYTLGFYQATLGYREGGFSLEGGVLLGGNGLLQFNLSGALHFGL